VKLYHGTPLTPISALIQLSGERFCVPYPRPDSQHICHEIGKGMMLDNGAFSLWRSGKPTDWPGFYAWVERWLDIPTTWAVIPDVIEADADVQDDLIRQWPHGERGAPVWHMHEPIERLLRLIETWARVCIGSSKDYAVVMSAAWERRMDEAWNAVWRAFRSVPNLHMLRGTQLAGRRWPFASADSTDIARNHNRAQNSPRSMADRWAKRAARTATTWHMRPEQSDMFALAASHAGSR
jgi:hypothetical protein